jgi:hypothetical protein
MDILSVVIANALKLCVISMPKLWSSAANSSSPLRYFPWVLVWLWAAHLGLQLGGVVRVAQQNLSRLLQAHLHHHRFALIRFAFAAPRSPGKAYRKHGGCRGRN